MRPDNLLSISSSLLRLLKPPHSPQWTLRVVIHCTNFKHRTGILVFVHQRSQI